LNWFNACPDKSIRSFLSCSVCLLSVCGALHSSRLGGSQEFPRLVHSTCTSSAPALKMHRAQVLEMLVQMECSRSVQVCKKCYVSKSVLQNSYGNNNSAQEVSKLCKKCLCYIVVCKSRKTHLLLQHDVRLYYCELR